MHDGETRLRLGVGICNFLQLLLAFIICHQLPVLHKPYWLVHLHVGLPICMVPQSILNCMHLHPYRVAVRLYPWQLVQSRIQIMRVDHDHCAKLRQSS